MEIGIAQKLASDSPGEVRRAEVRLLRGAEDRRRFEEWRTGKRLYLALDGFTRANGVLELRGRLQEETPGNGALLFDGSGVTRRWHGPGMPRPNDNPAVEDLPISRIQVARAG